MENICVFKTRFIEECKLSIKNDKKIDLYFGEKFHFNQDDIFNNKEFGIERLPELILPEKNNNHNAENAIRLYESLKSLNQTLASDVRFWTYLAHVTYWKYMQVRFPIDQQPREKRAAYIMSHWHIDSLNTANLTRHHGISSLWWGAFRTYDDTRKDPFELTKELFSMLDYTTHLMSGTQGRNQEFFRAVLEFVVDNQELFAMYKETKIRFIMRSMNRTGGYKIFAGMSKESIIKELNLLKGKIKMIKSQS